MLDNNRFILDNVEVVINKDFADLIIDELLVTSHWSHSDEILSCNKKDSCDSYNLLIADKDGTPIDILNPPISDTGFVLNSFNAVKQIPNSENNIIEMSYFNQMAYQILNLYIKKTNLNISNVQPFDYTYSYHNSSSKGYFTRDNNNVNNLYTLLIDLSGDCYTRILNKDVYGPYVTEDDFSLVKTEVGEIVLAKSNSWIQLAENNSRNFMLKIIFSADIDGLSEKFDDIESFEPDEYEFFDSEEELEVKYE